MKLINEYLDYLDNQELLVESKGGAIGTLNQILLFFGWGAPKDAHVRRLYNMYMKGIRYCHQNFGSKQRTTTTKTGEEDPAKIMKTIEENPDLGKCSVRVKIQYLKDLVKYLDEQPEKACKAGLVFKRINPDLCHKWIEKHLPDFKDEIRMADKAVMDTQNQKNVSVVINKLKKIL